MKKRLFFILAILLTCILLLLFFRRHEVNFLYNKFFGEQIHQKVSTETESVPEKIKITFLDIGQGDASFIEWADGTQMLIDCAIDARILEALGRVMAPMDHTIDYLVVSHPDQDHYGGCVDILKRFDVKHIVYNAYKKNSKYFPVFMQVIEAEVKNGAQYHEIQKEETWNIASSTLHFLYPDIPNDNNPLILKSKKTDPSNNTSILMILQYGKEKIMFTGDAEFEEENYLMKKYSASDLDIDVLKLAHHGSAGSSSDAFLKILTPTYAVISSGKENTYGHPSLRTLHRLERSAAKILRTDIEGDILLNIFTDRVYVENE